MEELILHGLGSKLNGELTDEDKLLINAVVRSGLSSLKEVSLSQNDSWFKHSEVCSYLLEFI